MSLRIFKIAWYSYIISISTLHVHSNIMMKSTKCTIYCLIVDSERRISPILKKRVIITYATSKHVSIDAFQNLLEKYTNKQVHAMLTWYLCQYLGHCTISYSAVNYWKHNRRKKAFVNGPSREISHPGHVLDEYCYEWRSMHGDFMDRGV